MVHGYTSVIFHHVYKGNFCDFLFVTKDDVTLLQWGLLFKARNLHPEEMDGWMFELFIDAQPQ